jgi:sugar lactone lactonase YvrE
MKPKWKTVFGVVMSVLLLWVGIYLGQPVSREAYAMSLVSEPVNAPEFPADLEWVNVDHPLSLRQLRGKVVLLDFWTYCCINCMHILPDLKKLEEKYKDELVVIGVHSAKFSTEQETDNIRQAVLRYDITHPVVNDADMTVWRSYGVRAWPTVVLIDPTGKIVLTRSGEGVFEPLDRAIAQVIRESKREGTLSMRPINLVLEKERTPDSLLYFPGKVLADKESNRLFIADTGHNRIVITDLEGKAADVAGSGEQGFKSGSFGEAQFYKPNGLALDGKNNVLYVADTDNHSVRKLDLRARTVQTIAGTGRQSKYLNQQGNAANIPLSSLWDLQLVGGDLYIAMAGTHQLWRLDLDSKLIGPYAGSTREGRIDGALLKAALAQPSGITTDGQKLYFADSETSSIRWADLNPRGKVETIVGQDLFVFGDRDGVGREVRLQHPIGIDYYQGYLYVADTYNNKIKRIDPKTRECVTLLGSGEHGFRDGDQPLFDEPEGLSVADGTIYIADTGNHSIRVASVKAKEVTTLQLTNLDMLRPPTEKKAGPQNEELARQSVKAGKVTIVVDVKLPSDHKLTENAPSQVTLTSTDNKVEFADGKKSVTVELAQVPVKIEAEVPGGESTIVAQFSLYYCGTANENLCFFKDAEYFVPIEASEAGGSEVNITCSVKEQSVNPWIR